jgi:hypothetical protein
VPTLEPLHFPESELISPPEPVLTVSRALLSTPKPLRRIGNGQALNYDHSQGALLGERRADSFAQGICRGKQLDSIGCPPMHHGDGRYTF